MLFNQDNTQNMQNSVIDTNKDLLGLIKKDFKELKYNYESLIKITTNLDQWSSMIIQQNNKTNSQEEFDELMIQFRLLYRYIYKNALKTNNIMSVLQEWQLFLQKMVR